MSSWVDDVGFDTHGRTPIQVAQTAIGAYRNLHDRLVRLGLKVNAKKTAFIATDKATDRALRDLLQPHEPQVASVMRDLGIDHQAASRRRIPVMKQRFAKAHQRKLKLRCDSGYTGVESSPLPSGVWKLRAWHHDIVQL